VCIKYLFQPRIFQASIISSRRALSLPGEHLFQAAISSRRASPPPAAQHLFQAAISSSRAHPPGAVFRTTEGEARGPLDLDLVDLEVKGYFLIRKV
jgi:hypothetical protein